MKPDYARLIGAALELRNWKTPTDISTGLNRAGLQISPQTLSNWQTRGVSKPQITAISRALGCRPIWLEYGEGNMTEVLPSSNFGARESSVIYGPDNNIEQGPAVRGEVPLISWVQAGSWAAVVDNFQPGDSEETIPTTVPIKRHTYALRVKGDSMTNPSGWPSFPEGMIIIVEPEFQHEPGDFVIVKNGNDEATFKQLIRDGSDWYLKPLNPRYPIKAMPVDAVICGVVRGYGGMLR